jgi:DNA-binding transcriptional LysR family regulator
MARFDLNDITAFLAVARVTKAAAKLGVWQSALSQTIRNLEARLGLRLLMRTTRSVSPTDAGERLLEAVAPRLEEIETELAALSALRDKPAGTVRIASSEHAADLILWPVVHKLLPRYPDITVEIIVDNGLTDIVGERLDAGVRLGEQVAKDMVAVRIGPDLRMAVVGAPSQYVFERVRRFAADKISRRPRSIYRERPSSAVWKRISKPLTSNSRETISMRSRRPAPRSRSRANAIRRT